MEKKSPSFYYCSVITAAVSVCITTSTQLLADSSQPAFPARKPGLWQINVSADESPGLGAVTQCIDKESDVIMQKAALSGPGGVNERCVKNEITPVIDGYNLFSECTISNSKVITSGKLVGDFDTGYKGKIAVKYTPPLFGTSESNVSIDAKWVGSCPTTMKPGDMKLPNGKIMNLLALQQKAQTATQMLKSPEMQKALKNAAKGIDPKMLEALTKGVE